MVYNLLWRLKQSGRLGDCVVVVSERDSVQKRIYGRDVIGVDRSCLRFRGGETGYEEFDMPLERVLEVRVNGKAVWRKKKQIKRIYPPR